MSNFTVAIPDDLLTDAKVLAAKTNASLNSIIRMLLEGFVKNESTTMSGNYEILMRYSLGQISTIRAMSLLHLDDIGSLKNLVVQSGLPLQRPSVQEEDAMQKRFSKMLDRAGVHA